MYLLIDAGCFLLRVIGLSPCGECVPTGADEDLYSINIRRFKEFLEDQDAPTATAVEGLRPKFPQADRPPCLTR